MADDASFHSCCEELHHYHQHPNQHQQHQHCRADKGAGGCFYSSDTDDEGQFLTASNSPLAPDAFRESADCFDEVGCRGGAVFVVGGGAGGDLERTLGCESRTSQSPSRSPSPSGSPHDRARPVIVASSTIAAEEPMSTRLDISGCGVDDDKFPPPLASSSLASVAGLRMALAANVAAAAASATPNKHNDDTAARADNDTEGGADDATTSGGSSQLEAFQYYRDNDLTPHRPASRRTRSGPIDAQTFANEKLRKYQGQHEQQHHRNHTRPPPAPPLAKSVSTTTLSTKPIDAVDAVELPARLRKRVRFADALGFDLASVVVIAGCADCDVIGSGRGDIEELFETFLLGAESELNRGRLFGESQSPQPATPPPPDPGWTPAVNWQPVRPSDSGRPVALEYVRFDGPALELSARVLNLAPHKSVTARVTFDDWRHHADWSLRYCPEAVETIDGGTERFYLRLYLPPNASEMALALRYCVAGRQYWDNNGGSNYVYRRHQKQGIC